LTTCIYLAHLNPVTNAHVEIIEEQKKENKVVVMPVRFLKGEKEINSKSFPFNFETRKKMIESVFNDSVAVSSNYTFLAPFKKYFPPLISPKSWSLRKQILRGIEGAYFTYTGDKAEGLMLKLYRLNPKVGTRKSVSATSVKNEMYAAADGNDSPWKKFVPSSVAKIINENWETICKFGKENDFDVIITLQPIAGFGNKVLTKQELKYAHTGEDYTNNPLIESSSIYQDYAKNLSEIKTCTKTFDIRDVFDTETGPIYWDQGHVSDRGNSIVAKSLFNIVFSIVSENYGFNIFETENGVQKTSSLLYDDREIVVTVELLPSNESENKKVKISTYDNTNKEDIQNVTYFLAISKNNENLLREYFFAKDGILTFDVFPKDSNQIQVLGEQQYDHNAYVMSDVIPLQVKGPIFSKDGTYAFDIELRTIDDPENWVFSLSGFHSEIIIGKDITFEETFTTNKSSLQTEDFFRKIFSYYKTPILLNEVFK